MQRPDGGFKAAEQVHKLRKWRRSKSADENIKRLVKITKSDIQNLIDA